MPRKRKRSRSRAGWSSDRESSEHSDDETHNLAAELYPLLFLWLGQVYEPGARLNDLFVQLEQRAVYIATQFPHVPLRIVTGITANPLRRFRSYIGEGFHRMFVVCKSDEASVIELAEQYLIRVLPSAASVTNTGEWIRYANVLKGADGQMRTQQPPYYTYLAVCFCGQDDELVSVGFGMYCELERNNLFE